MNWLIMLAFCAAYAALGWHARGPLAAAWWRGLATLAEARVKVVEAERDAALWSVAGSRDMYLTRLDRCIGCATCNPEPQGFDLPDYEFGAPE